MPSRYETIAEAFWSHATPGSPTECWPWHGSLDLAGYGRFFWNGLTYKAHRVSLEIHGIAIPDHCFACHRCPLKSCVNVAHLYPGTPEQNVHDMMRLQRHWHGERHHRAKLTLKEVEHIRTLSPTHTNVALAAMFGVHNGTISRIVRGMNWRKHIDDPRTVHTGTRGSRGTKHYATHFTDDDVRHIRSLRPTHSLKILAQQFETTIGNISNICLYKSWRHVP